MKRLSLTALVFCGLVGCDNSSGFIPSKKQTDTVFIYKKDSVFVKNECKPYAVIAGIYDGKSSKGQLLSKAKIEIIGNDSLTIVSYKFVCSENGARLSLKCETDKFSSDVINTIANLKSGTTDVYFEEIIAKNKNGDTVKLNPIHIFY